MLQHFFYVPRYGSTSQKDSSIIWHLSVRGAIVGPVKVKKFNPFYLESDLVRFRGLGTNDEVFFSIQIKLFFYNLDTFM